ncbi:hypothetical protein ACJWDR_37830 [Streptomyces tauricus]|uniref:hypothetical protein n=1 Tax=Streptomyces tauricus TaxID=68274 RepID=UPI00387F24E3
MTDMQPYERLSLITPEVDDDEVEFDEYLWSALFEYADGPAPDPDTIEVVTNVWATSPEGYGSVNLALLARLADGRWATCVAWADTTGFGCQQGVDWRVNDTRELAISQGLDKEARAHLGLPLSSEARPCAECPEPTAEGRAYCSTRCRNAGDRHDEMDGDL